jgi:general secretion pathway protein G
MGRLPISQEGVESLIKPPLEAENWQGPYVKAVSAQKDPWGHDRIYRQPSVRSGDRDYDPCSGAPTCRGSEPGDGESICNP